MQLFIIAGFYCPIGASAVVMDNLYSVISLLRPQFCTSCHSWWFYLWSQHFTFTPTKRLLQHVIDRLLPQSGRKWANKDIRKVIIYYWPCSRFKCELLVLAPLANSDHKTIVLTLIRPCSYKRLPQPRKTVWIYQRADIQLAKHLLRDLPMASTSDNIGRNDLNPSWQPSGNPFHPSW